MIILSDITCGRKFSLMEVLYEESWREPGTMERMEEGMRLSSGGMAPSQGGVWGYEAPPSGEGLEWNRMSRLGRSSATC